MTFLNLQTIMVSFVFTNLVCAAVLFYLWKENRTRYEGLNFWVISYAGNFIGLILLSLRGIIPDFWTRMLGSIILLGVLLVFFLGIQLFFGKKVRNAHNYVLLAIYFLFQAYFVYIHPSLEIRNILYSIFVILFFSQIAWFLLKKTSGELRGIARDVGFVSLLMCVIALVRIVENLFIPPANNVLTTSDFDAAIYVAFQMGYIILTFALFMLVNRRLFFDLQSDIAERKKTEAELQLSQEITSKAFQSSPDAVIITRVSDGKIVELNESFTRISGFSREEALASTTISLNFWVNRPDREVYVAEMQKNSRVRDFNFDLRVKSGRIIKAQISGEIIQIRGETCMLSVTRDITETKRLENLIQLRLKLWEYSMQHSAAEILQKALDELEGLTDSQYTFFRFVEPDLKGKTFDGCSTNAMIMMGPYRNNGSEHPFNRGSICDEVIRAKNSIVVNAFTAKSESQDLPEGQDLIIRELVVPVLRDDQVVAILGMVNKSVDYDNGDVETAEYLATLLWSLISRKQAEEKVMELNSQLQQLAMMDDLTNLPNRRSFFTRGSDEVSRSRRYKEPLSLIMLDIDHFKTINDTFGHESGDIALQQLARLLSKHTRSVDIPARLGGEEFGILLPNTPLANAAILAERLRHAVEEECCQGEEKKLSITASFGVAEFEPEMKNLDELFRAADTAMYQAKYRGRNQVVLAD